MSTQTGPQKTDTAPQFTVHHFILTLIRQGGTTSTRAGTWNAPAGTTRETALKEIANHTFPGEFPNLTVLFFSLEPNQL